MSPEAREHSFDELTRGLASGSISRGKALRLMGATLVGGALASIPGIAWAKPNRPAGAKCKRNEQCASGQCVETRVGGVCAAAACAGCPEPCICETEFFSGDQVCIQPISRIETDCTACDLVGGEVCVGGGTVGEVGCATPCP